MEAMTQKTISDLFNTKPKKQANSIKYCISKVTNETKDKEEEAEKSEKQVKKPVRRPKRERNKGDYGSTVQLSRFT